MTALLKFWFQQDAKMAVTACFFQHIGKVFEDFCGIYIKIVLLSWFYSNGEKHLWIAQEILFLFLRGLFMIFSMVSAADQNCCDLHDFLAFGNVTCDCWIDWNGTVFLRVIDGWLSHCWKRKLQEIEDRQTVIWEGLLLHLRQYFKEVACVSWDGRIKFVVPWLA